MPTTDNSGSPQPAPGSTQASESPTPPITINVNGANTKEGAKQSLVPPTLLSRLNEYKELITIVMFFLGGAIWLYSAFATKAYVGNIRCLLGATIERVDNEAQSRTIKADIVEGNTKIEQLKADLTKAQSTGAPTAPIIAETERLKLEVKALEKRKDKADELVANSNKRVLNGECGA